MIRVAADELRRFAAAVIERMGATPADAAWTAGMIVDSDLAGHESHGMRRLSEYVAHWRAGSLDPAAQVVVERDDGTTLRLDGCKSFGHVALLRLTDLAIERARAHGVCALSLRRAGQTGRIADFLDRAAGAGVVLLLWINDSGGYQEVAPPGALDARLATNPIGVGVPRAGRPHFVLDMSTSVIARGRVSEELDRGTVLPSEWVNERGVIRPLGGYKGFGLALAAEMLAGILSGSGFVGPEPVVFDQGVFAVAIDIERFRPLAAFATDVEAMLDYVRDVELEPGASDVRIPGELSEAARRRRLVDGVPVQDFTWERLSQVSAELDVPLPQTLD